MHIAEGILPLKWAGVWYIAAIPFVAKGLTDIKKKVKLNPNFKPLLGLMAAAVFIISCLPVPVPTAGTCSHPCGTGLSAILLGPVMSILITSVVLFIQALFMAHGGITTWGADVVSMGIAGSFVGYLTFKTLRRLNASLFVCGFCAGVLADWATYAVTSFELACALHGNKPVFSLFSVILVAFIPTQLPLGILEGFLTGGMVSFISKRRPDILTALSMYVGEGFKLSTVRKESRRFFNGLKIILLMVTCISFYSFRSPAAFAQKWQGIDKNVVEKVAQEHGRPAWKPFINTDQGDLLLFVFLLAGAAGGFVLGFYWRKLFHEKTS